MSINKPKWGDINTVAVFFRDLFTGDPIQPEVINGGLVSGERPLNYVTYSDATYTYYCEAPPGPGIARSDALWQVSRKTNATGDIVYAGTGAFDQVATDITAVGALTYTLGA